VTIEELFLNYVSAEHIFRVFNTGIKKGTQENSQLLSDKGMPLEDIQQLSELLQALRERLIRAINFP
jgi:predicted KAP-like P-loop ATPase